MELWIPFPFIELVLTKEDAAEDAEGRTIVKFKFS